MGYGGFIPHVDRRPFILSDNHSRALRVGSLLRVIARPVDCVLCGFYLLGAASRAVASARRTKLSPPCNTGG